MTLPPVNAPQTLRLLERTVRRLRFLEFWRRFFWVYAAITAVCLGLLLVVRLTSLVPDFFSPGWLTALVPASAIIAWLTHRRPKPAEAARVLDGHLGVDDLFLTVVNLDSSAGRFQGMVRRNAEARAGEPVLLAQALPWVWRRPSAVLLGISGALLLSLWFVPSLDPFGKQELRNWLGKKEERLKILRQETEKVLAGETSSMAEERSEAIQSALNRLEQSFRMAKPEEREANAERLTAQQKELGQFWRQLNDEQLGKALSRAESLQQLGGRFDGERASEALRKKIRDLLQQRDFDGVTKEIAKLSERIERMAQERTPEGERGRFSQQQLDEIRRGLQDLEAAIAQNLEVPGLAESLARAQEQLQFGQVPELSDQAMDDLAQSLQAAGQQLGDLSQNLQDLQKLEEALEAAQLAKQLNELGKLGGQDSQAESMQGGKSYAELYKELLAQAAEAGGYGDGAGGDGSGEGTGGRGQGRGGEPPEDESIETDFRADQAPSALLAGKILMQWETEGVAESGEARKAYERSMEAVKQHASEAVRLEEVPAGYHENVRRYFDTLEEAVEGAPAAQGEAANE